VIRRCAGLLAADDQTSRHEELVPAWRSSINKVSAARRMLEAKESGLTWTNQLQHVSGIRIQVMPGARWRMVVVMNPIALINDDRAEKADAHQPKDSVPNPWPEQQQPIR